MNINLFLLIIVVVTALAFDFTNGFHDTGNAMATSIASGALAPKAAVALSAVLNLVGAFMSTAVAATIAKGLIDGHIVTLELVFAGLVGGIVWNLLTWLLGIPSSSSHALIGGIVGATIAAVGAHGVIWQDIVSKVLIPAVVAAILAFACRGDRHLAGLPDYPRCPGKRSEAGFRYGQWGSASLVSLAHGTNDAQKTMGIIFLALMSYGAISKNAVHAAVLGHRVLRPGDGLGYLPGRLADHPHPGQGTRGDQVAAGHGRRIVLGRSHSAVRPLRLRAVDDAGLHRSVMGSGLGKPGGEVRWGVAGRMATAWLITLPAGRFGRRDHLLDRAPDRRIPRRDHRLLLAGRGLCRHLHPVAQGQGRPQERQRRVGRQPDGRTRRGRASTPSDTGGASPRFGPRRHR